MLLHINPTRQRGKRTGSLARASGWYMTFFAAGVIVTKTPPSKRLERELVVTKTPPSEPHVGEEGDMLDKPQSAE